MEPSATLSPPVPETAAEPPRFYHYSLVTPRVEQSWQNERERWMMRDKYGHSHKPTVGQGIFGGIAISILGFCMAAGVTGTPTLGYVGWLLVIVGIAVGVEICRKAEAYNNAEQKYYAEVERIESELAGLDFAPER